MRCKSNSISIIENVGIAPVKNTGNFRRYVRRVWLPHEEGSLSGRSRRKTVVAVAALKGIADAFVFSPRTDGVYVSEYYVDGKYKGDRHPPYRGCFPIRSEARYLHY